MQSTKENSQIISTLRELGFTVHEASVYLALMERPSATASELCTVSGIPDSKIYGALNRLHERDLIHSQSSTPKVYHANSPEDAFKILKEEARTRYEERVREIDSLIDALTPRYEASREGEDSDVAYMVRGRQAVLRRMTELIRGSENNAMVLLSSAEIYRDLEGVLKDAVRVGKLDLALGEELRDRAPRELGAVALFCPCNIVVSDSRKLLTVSEYPVYSALLLNDRGLIEALKEYFKEGGSRCG